MMEESFSSGSDEMFEYSRDLKLSTPNSISGFPNNLSVYHLETKNITYACVAHKNSVSVLTWDMKMDNVTFDNLQIKDFNTDRAVTVQQCKFVQPSARTTPLIIVATNTAALVYDSRTHKLLALSPLDTGMSETIINEWNVFCRGITWVDNTILVGTYTGELLVFNCSGETSVTVKKSIKEHNEAICDLATCRFDELTCSVDMGGTVIVWGKNAKSVQKKISTEHTVNVINVLRKQCIVGTLRGKVLFYSTVNGALMAEVLCHSRPVTSVAVAPESAYVLTCGEDGHIHVFKLHTRKPEAYQVEFRHMEIVENQMLVGAQFMNGRGSGIVSAGFDRSCLGFYRIAKKPTKGEGKD